MPRRLGCLTGAGLISAALTLLLSLGMIAVRGGSWFNPGPLNAQAGGAELGGVTSHAATGGRCEACHSAPWDAATLTDRCLACHTDVADQLADPASLHGALKGQGGDMACRGCHVEHRGAAADLTNLDPATFLHDAVGYTLAGHATLADGHSFACADCHTEKLTVFDVAVCADCHRQADAAYMQGHVADFGAACLSCHDGADRYSKRHFDHNRLPFPLTGKHADAACAGCHADARTAADLQAAPQACVGCHQADDAHKGQFGTDCAACHQTAGWKPATFDHSKSAFPLTGKHVAAKCESCHVNQVFRGTPQTCIGCHQADDAHKGQFGTDCAACHQTAGWKPATFDHSQSAFPLTGKHVAAQCESCHVNQVFRGTAKTCVGCHQQDDTHKGEFGTDCAACHKTEGWKPAAFDHSKSAFPLTGKHVAAKCESCHAGQVFKGTANTCVGCHQDPAYHLGTFGTACADCHTADAWWSAKYGRPHTFPLDHGESGISSCKTCHPDQLKAYTCYGCHEHTLVEIQRKHVKEGIPDFTDCMKCHPTGREKAGEGGGDD